MGKNVVRCNKISTAGRSYLELGHNIFTTVMTIAVVDNNTDNCRSVKFSILYEFVIMYPF